jgi:glycosyltransferase involved in cell wall biosynthesis
MQRHLHTHYPSLRTPITVIPSWADPDTIQPIPDSTNPFVLQHGLSEYFVVLYSGNQGRCHDLVTLLDSAELLLSHSKILFLIVGSGAQHRSLVQQVHDRELVNVRFLPFQEVDQLPALLACADLAVVSLLPAAEGMVAPSKLYGHLASARPVAAICSPHSYLRTEIARAGCGTSVDSGDSHALASFIRQLAADPDLALRLGQSGRRYLLSTATPSIIVQAYAEMLSRHLPLKRKSYAQPLNDDAEPLPDPSNALTSRTRASYSS